MATFDIRRGDTKPFTAAVTLSGAAYDVTGKLLIYTVKRRTSDPDASAIMRLTSTAGRITIATSNLSWSIRPSDWSSEFASPIQTPVTLRYDLQLVVSATEVYTLESGELRVLPDVSISTAA